MDSFANIPKMEQRDETILKGAQRTKFDFDKNFDHSNIPLKDEKFPVIIIGSSMVGMSLGVLLGYYGVKSISFDRHPSTAIHPRAALFLLRTIEIFRQLGLADLMEQESVLNFDLDAGMLVIESLVGGKVLMRIQESDPAKTAEVTPAKRLWLTQNMFEPLLRTEAHRFGAQQKFSTNVVHYEEQADGVIVIVQDLETKKYFKYKTDYLVATDGGRSATRKFEGIEWRGPGIQSNNISVNFRADLTPYLGSRAVHGVTYITNPKISAGFRLEGAGKAGFMIVSSTKDRQEFEPDSVTADEAKQYFYDASGIKAEIDIQVDSVSYWTAAAFNADHYSSKRGRVFLAGDAAHVVPPTGGMGGNTGIQDTYNLAWKLAYVVQGKAAPNLLKTYSEERKPTVECVMQQAYSRLVNRVSEDKSVPHEKELPDIICEIGYRYVNGAFIRSTAPVASEPWEDPHAPAVTPGSRIPHVMLTDHANGDAQVSTLDLVKQNFILFTADPSSPWLAAVSKQKIKVDAYGISKDSQPLADTADKFAKTLKLDSKEAILVRPDGHIAWRGSSEDGQEQSTVESVLQEILWG